MKKRISEYNKFILSWWSIETDILWVTTIPIIGWLILIFTFQFIFPVGYLYYKLTRLKPWVPK